MDYITYILVSTQLLWYNDDMYTYMKKDGFTHEKLLVLPKQVLNNSRINPIAKNLYLSDIGYFPRAKHHYRDRLEGCPNHIFILCVDGEGTVEMNGTSYNISQNQFVIIPKDTAHKYYANKKRPWTIYWFHFNGEASPAYMERLHGNQPIGQMGTLTLARFIKQFGVIYNLLEGGYSDNHITASSNLLGLMLLGDKVPQIWDEKAYSKKNPVDECIGYMLEQINQRLTIKQLSAHMHLSQSHMIDLFKEHTGYAPIDYFIHLKVQKACQMLDRTDMTIQAIALEVGYDDPFYFSRLFKKVMGIPPRAYRKTEKG